MKLRKARKQFWWTWHHKPWVAMFSMKYGWFDWGVGRIKHQMKDTVK